MDKYCVGVPPVHWLPWYVMFSLLISNVLVAFFPFFVLIVARVLATC